MMTLTCPFEFSLPPELEAHEPPEARGLSRDQVRLLVSMRDHDRMIHSRFPDLPAFLRPGDLLVLNDSATIPAALAATRSNGAPVMLHLSTRLPAELWVVEPRKVEAGSSELLNLPGGGTAQLLVPYRHSRRLWVAHLVLPMPVLDYLGRWGQPIVYPYVRGTWPIEMYQTVYASEPGSAEMPSAGRPFTHEILRRLAQDQVRITTITLHAGVASLERDEAPYEEFYHVPPEAAEAVAETQRAGGRVIAVGTTVVRAVESAVDVAGRATASRGWTDLVIARERGVRVVDGMLTGFHEPRAPHLAMLEAIVGRAHLERAYRTALDAGYLWHEFGDVHLIL